MQRGDPVGQSSCGITPDYFERNELTFGPHARGNSLARSDIIVMTCKEGLQKLQCRLKQLAELFRQLIACSVCVSTMDGPLSGKATTLTIPA